MTLRPESCPLYPRRKEAAGSRDGIDYRVGILDGISQPPKQKGDCEAERLIGKKSASVFISVPCPRCGVQLLCETRAKLDEKLKTRLR